MIAGSESCDDRDEAATLWHAECDVVADASRRSWCSYKKKTKSHGKLTTSDIEVMPTGHNRDADACAKLTERSLCRAAIASKTPALGAETLTGPPSVSDAPRR